MSVVGSVPHDAAPDRRGRGWRRALIQPSAISGWAALNHHGLTEQIPRIITLTTPKRVVTPAMRGAVRTALSTWEVAGQTFEIVMVVPAHFYGDEEIWIGDSRVRMFDRERALLDCFALPRRFGGARNPRRARAAARPEAARGACRASWQGRSRAARRICARTCRRPARCRRAAPGSSDARRPATRPDAAGPRRAEPTLGAPRESGLAEEAEMKPLQRHIQQAARDGRVSQIVVERDYVQSYVLLGIARQAELRETLLFKGGTMLKKVHFKNYRFSCRRLPSRFPGGLDEGPYRYCSTRHGAVGRLVIGRIRPPSKMKVVSTPTIPPRKAILGSRDRTAESGRGSSKPSITKGTSSISRPTPWPRNRLPSMNSRESPAASALSRAFA